jgi:hypothetical protein
MERRRRSSVAVRITLSLAVLAVAVAAVVIGALGVFGHGGAPVSCPATQASAPSPNSRPCIERTG